jgi:PBSX family phage terminase large subunit
MLAVTSTPSISEFNPGLIPWQLQAIKDVRVNWDYSLGVHEAIWTGSVGSAKSLLGAHVIVTHCIQNPGARVLVGRKALTDLKETILTKIIEHIQVDMIEGVHYNFNQTTSTITFLHNNSEIICKSWNDKRYRKFRSYELSAAFIEELTENDSEEFNAFYKEIKARVGRLPHIKENWIISATNPDSPAHSIFDYFWNSDSPTRHIAYSITTDNPFLPETYISGLKESFTEKECRRMIYGEWLEISSEQIYYAWDSDASEIDEYEVNKYFPIIVSFDFNIGDGKPMSVCLAQYINGKFIFFDEIVIEGARTLSVMEELAARGYLDGPNQIIIMGDATGRARSTNFNRTDYEVVEAFIQTYKRDDHQPVDYAIDVGRSNPAVRTRHVKVNGQLKNAYGQTFVYVLKSKCPTIIKGFRLTQLKKGGKYIENDGPAHPYQHISTACGYLICRKLLEIENPVRVTKRKI